LNANPHLFKKGFGAVLTLPPNHPGLERPKTLKVEGYF